MRPPKAGKATPKADPNHQLGLEHYRAKRYREAELAFRRVLTKNPNDINAMANIALMLKLQGKLVEACGLNERLLKLNPTNSNVLNNQANLLLALGRPEEAAMMAERATVASPNLASCWCTLGWVLLAVNRFQESAQASRKALELEPGLQIAMTNLGSALHRLGDCEAALEGYRAAIARAPNDSLAHSNLLFEMHFSPRFSLQELADEAERWNQRHARPVMPPPSEWPKLRDRNGAPPRIGFVSGDLRRHPVAYFFASMLEARTPGSFDVVFYSNSGNRDEMTTRLHRQSVLWRDIIGLSDIDFAAQVRTDEIDILFDLAGHTGENRLLAFARKAAPIQASWIGYFDSTGLDSMDYLLADPNCIPPDKDWAYKERVIRLPDGFLCYEPPAIAPKVGPLPAISRGFVMFGSANQLTKVTPEVVSIWAKTVLAVPNAMLALKTKALGEATVREALWQRFEAAGLPRDRVALLPPGNQIDILNFYNQIDIALDPFPCAGGTTTCEALWMGVPVITALGERFCNRHSASHLRNAGFGDLVVERPEDMPALAARLGSDIPALAALRARLRPAMAASPLCDAPRFAANFTRALHQMLDQGPRLPG